MAHQDYIPSANEIIRFGAGERIDCFEIELVDDRKLEDSPETFTVTIIHPEGSLATGSDICSTQTHSQWTLLRKIVRYWPSNKCIGVILSSFYSSNVFMYTFSRYHWF